jgi:hypothetical protein
MERVDIYGNGMCMTTSWMPSHMARHNITSAPSNPVSTDPENQQSPHSAVPFTGPVYVNARQYARILKRREAKLIIEAKLKLNPPRKRYLHESRHNHACKRPRGTGGRFLTKAELDAMKTQGQQRREESNEFLSDHANELNRCNSAGENDTETSNRQSLNYSEAENTDQDEPNHDERFDDAVSL